MCVELGGGSSNVSGGGRKKERERRERGKQEEEVELFTSEFERGGGMPIFFNSPAPPSRRKSLPWRSDSRLRLRPKRSVVP